MSSKKHKGGHGGEHENAERWLLTYADMITLLVAFFIMLYAMSVTNQAKFNTLAISVRSGFGNITANKPSILDGESGGRPKPSLNPAIPMKTTVLPGGGESADKRSNASDSQVLKDLQKMLSQGELAKHVEVRMEERGIVVTILADNYTFNSGSADLKPAFRPLLDMISKEVKKVPNVVRIEGHTDNLPISNDRFPSNWQLSATRAANVLSYMVSNTGISPDRINCVGYGDRRPLLPNTSAANRARNRRIEIVILREADNMT